MTGVGGGDGQDPKQELPAGTLGAERRSLAGFAGRTGRRGAFLHVCRCEEQARYRVLCQSAFIHEQDGYLLAVLGEHMQPVAAALLGHELAHRSGWRRRLARTATLARVAGWMLAGWTAGWPCLLAAGAVVQALTMLAFCAVESGCDLHAAREHGTGALIIAIMFDHTLHERMPRWELRLFRGFRHLTGLTRHPPGPVRCLILRILAPAAHDQAGASALSGTAQ